MSAALGLAARHAIQLSREGDIIGTAQAGDKPFRLRHVADGATQLESASGDVAAEDASAAGRGRQQAEQDFEQSRFTGAVRSEEADAPGRQATGDALEGVEAAVPARDIVQLNEGDRLLAQNDSLRRRAGHGPYCSRGDKCRRSPDGAGNDRKTAPAVGTTAKRGPG